MRDAVEDLLQPILMTLAQVERIYANVEVRHLE
jgi:hypothetical protein